ncbi:hypothetical protein A2U01_0092110, partial [Trifolium medium]|nr:hypothetical protein [Trifolium medium]
HLRKFLDDAAKGHIALPNQESYQPKGKRVEEGKGGKGRVTVNTTAGGFAGGDASNSARRCYVRQSAFEVMSIGHQTSLSS